MLFIAIISTIAVVAPHTEIVASDMSCAQLSICAIDSQDQSKATDSYELRVEKTENPSNNDDKQLPSSQNMFAWIREDEATEGQSREA